MSRIQDECRSRIPDIADVHGDSYVAEYDTAAACFRFGIRAVMAQELLAAFPMSTHPDTAHTQADPVEHHIASGDALRASRHLDAALLVYAQAARLAVADRRIEILTRMFQVYVELAQFSRAVLLAREILEYFLAHGRADDAAAFLESLSRHDADAIQLRRLESLVARRGAGRRPDEAGGSWLESSSLRYLPTEDFSQQSVLLVEDDPSQMALFVSALEPLGCEILQASNGIEALETMQARFPALIVSDLVMPDMNGSQLYERLQASPATELIPFVCLSSNTSEREVVAALNRGIEDYWFKPVRPVEFRARVQRLLRRVKDAAALRGNLEEMSAADLLQTLEANKRTGTLVLQTGAQLASVYIVDGTPIDASLGSERGAAAVYTAATWNRGSFVFSSRLPNRRRTIFVGAQALLLEAFRIFDEARRNFAEGPAA